MRLHRQAREYYKLQITTDPPVTAWDASFDGGVTWVLGILGGDGVTRWLVQGPDFTGDPATPLATPIPVDCSVLLRATDTPEVIVTDAPSIRLV